MKGFSTAFASDRLTLLDGTEVATWTIGPPPGHDSLGDIVVCHGTPWSSQMWRALAIVLSRRFRVFLWDMPGYGASIPEHIVSPAEAGPPLDLITQSRRLAELFDSWDLERPHVIAHDIGGAVALRAHLFEGRDFASLYLLDIVTLSPWGSPFFRLVAENEAVFSALPEQLHRALVTEYIAGAAGPSLTPEQLEELAAPWCTTAGQAAFYHQIASLRPEHTEPIVDRLGKVRCPVRIGWGESDPWIPVEHANRLATALPGQVEVTRFPCAGHLVPLESADHLVHDLEQWLDIEETQSL